MHILIILALLILLTVGPQAWVRHVMARYNREEEPNFPGNGGELARHLLDNYGLDHVRVEQTEHGDHYDPSAKAVRLQADNINGYSLTAITIAAHEVGHAIQDSAGERLFRWRGQLAAVAQRAERIGSFLLFAAPLLTLLSRAPSPGIVSALAAFLLMGVGILVQLITLPVELDASFRKALPILRNGYLEPDQIVPAQRILRAAAFTYVAASLAGLLNFWRWLRVLRR